MDINRGQFTDSTYTTGGKGFFPRSVFQNRGRLPRNKNWSKILYCRLTVLGWCLRNVHGINRFLTNFVSLLINCFIDDKIQWLSDGVIQCSIKWLIYPSTDSLIAWLITITILKRLIQLFKKQYNFFTIKWSVRPCVLFIISFLLAGSLKT